jgi:hypothetical protein
MNLRHPGLVERMASFPSHQQILMVANELVRAKNLAANPREFKNALERALELLDLLCRNVRKYDRLRELRRARELIARLYVTPEFVSLPTLIQTFIQLDPTAWKMLKSNKR